MPRGIFYWTRLGLPYNGNVSLSPRKRVHRTLVWILLVAALGWGAVVIATLLRAEPLALLAPLSDSLPEVFMIVAGGVGVISIFLALYAYIKSLDPFQLSRSKVLVYLNFLSPALCLAVFALTLLSGGKRIGEDIEVFAIGAALLASLLVPLAALGAETVLGRSFSGLGRIADEQGATERAAKLLLNSLRWRPRDEANARRCGILMADIGQHQAAATLLQRFGPAAENDDIEMIRALETVYTGLGEPQRALECLERQKALKPQIKGIDRRLLTAYLSLDLREKAIALLESGRIPLDVEMLLVLENLYLKTGNIAQALARARQIASREPPPFDRSIRVLGELLEQMPGNLELRIDLGMLLQQTERPEEMRAGAEQLEAALELDPRRLHLRRQLAAYYLDSQQTERAIGHFEALIAGGDLDPQTYLKYAGILLAEKKLEDALRVYQKMQSACDGDWQAFAGEAQVQYQLDDMDKASTALRRAEELKPPDVQATLGLLARRIAHRREEFRLSRLSEDVSADGSDVQKRFDFIRQLLSLDKGDQAITQCDLLLDEYPDRAADVQHVLEEFLGRIEHSFRVQDYLADLYFRQGLYNRALSLYSAMAEHSLHPERVLEEGCKRILGKDPFHIESRVALSDLYLRREQWEAVLENYAPILDRLPPEEDLLIKAEWVEAAYQAGQFDDAMRVGLEIFPRMQDSARFMTMLIRILEDNSQYQRAYEIFKVAFAAFPEDPTLQKMERIVADNKKRSRMEALVAKAEAGTLTPQEHFEKGDLHREFLQYHLAIVHHQQAADDPDLHDLALAKIAVSLCDRRLFELAYETLGAISLTKETIQKHRELKSIFYHVGLALDLEGFRDGARDFYKRIFRIDASFRDVVNRLERLGES